MGACASCLGLRRSDSEDPETSRLLNDDYRQYGGAHTQRQPQQPDPESLRREREVLEAIVHRMSSQVIDVFNAPSASTVRSTARNTQVNGSIDDSASDDAVLLAKNGRAEPIISVVGKDFTRWKAVKDAIG